VCERERAKERAGPRSLLHNVVCGVALSTSTLARTDAQRDQDELKPFATRGDRKGEGVVAPHSLDVIHICYLEEGGRKEEVQNPTVLAHGGRSVHRGWAEHRGENAQCPVASQRLYARSHLHPPAGRCAAHGSHLRPQSRPALSSGACAGRVGSMDERSASE
jgi:hypothetical protein